MSIDYLIAARLQRLRKLQGLTIETLAAKSGVSRGMISKIERRDSSPSAHVLGKLAAGLGVSLTALLIDEMNGSDGELLRPREKQTVWRDPAVGYLRRQVTER
ncbi:helix-turn-helix domain-containing protein [Candidatus Sodalis endolongispinus]|uniref:helix-turn-helix domain-containing protein n=1 Tax=Candidatus Sodalis endolongispinus TaxID=2812662 RepID=UPI001FE6F0BA|nr:helix-turn-helix transcriptional regulator [Candidatus Sodalis endolongispinus]